METIVAKPVRRRKFFDDETYTYLLKTHPEGTDMVCEEEGLNFEKNHGP